MYKLICFDFDGVIIDSGEVCENFAMDEFPAMSRKEAKDLYVGNVFEQLKKITHTRVSENDFEIAREKYRTMKRTLPLCVGVQEMLQVLPKDIPLVINSSSSEDEIKRSLIFNNIENYFKDIFAKESSKSKVEKFQMISDKYSISIDEMLFVTDTLGDVVEASELLIPTLVVLWGIHDKSYFDHEKYSNIVGFIEKPEEISSFVK